MWLDRCRCAQGALWAVLGLDEALWMEKRWGPCGLYISFAVWILDPLETAAIRTFASTRVHPPFSDTPIYCTYHPFRDTKHASPSAHRVTVVDCQTGVIPDAKTMGPTWECRLSFGWEIYAPHLLICIIGVSHILWLQRPAHLMTLKWIKTRRKDAIMQK